MQERPSPVLETPDGCWVHLLPRPVTAEEYLVLYRGVGDPWQWLDRRVLPAAELEALVNRQDTHIWVLIAEGILAGYAEFVVQPTHVELQYFGLFEAFVGRGIGKWFLNWAVHHAWDYGAPRVQVNTCSLDHPRALGAYQKAGFVLEREVEEMRKVPG